MMLFQSPARPAMCRASTAHVRPSSTGFTGCGKSRIQAVFSGTGTLACAVLLELTSMHSQEWLCYSTFSAACEACATQSRHTVERNSTRQADKQDCPVPLPVLQFLTDAGS